MRLTASRACLRQRRRDVAQIDAHTAALARPETVARGHLVDRRGVLSIQRQRPSRGTLTARPTLITGISPERSNAYVRVRAVQTLNTEYAATARGHSELIGDEPADRGWRSPEHSTHECLCVPSAFRRSDGQQTPSHGVQFQSGPRRTPLRRCQPIPVAAHGVTGQQVRRIRDGPGWHVKTLGQVLNTARAHVTL